MQRQELFEKVVRGLASQNWRRSVVYESCLYRGPNGLKCAVGWLIPDNEYRPGLEGHSIVELHMKDYGSPPSITSLDNESFALAELLQEAHDDLDLDLREAFRAIASSENLEWPKDV